MDINKVWGATGGSTLHTAGCKSITESLRQEIMICHLNANLNYNSASNMIIEDFLCRCSSPSLYSSVNVSANITSRLIVETSFSGPSEQL